MFLNVIMFIFISFLYKIESVIVFNFEKKIKLANINEDMLYDYFFNNDYITYISIGTPPQKVPLNIHFDKHTFFVGFIQLNNLRKFLKSQHVIS